MKVDRHTRSCSSICPRFPSCLTPTIAEEEYVTEDKNHALCDTFLKSGMLIGLVMRFSKTTGYKLGLPPGGQ